jgi:hypothetical protein
MKCIIWLKAVNVTYWKTQLDWAESDLHDNKRLEEAGTPVTWSQSDSSEPATERRKIIVKWKQK